MGRATAVESERPTFEIDRESAEQEIFRGMDEGTAREIDQTTMEVHRVEAGKPDAVRSRLTGLGFQPEADSLLSARR